MSKSLRKSHTYTGLQNNVLLLNFFLIFYLTLNDVEYKYFINAPTMNVNICSSSNTTNENKYMIMLNLKCKQWFFCRNHWGLSTISLVDRVNIGLPVSSVSQCDWRL